MEMFLYENYGIVIYDLSQGVSPPTSCHSSWGSCAVAEVVAADSADSLKRKGLPSSK
jgi:hypothetical protein